MNIEFARPLILLLIPLMIVGLIYSGKFLRVKNKGKKIGFILIRILVMTLLLVGLSGMTIKWSSDETTTIFLVDMSDSDISSIDTVENYLANAIDNVPEKNTVGIVTFGADSAIEQFVTDKKIFDEVTTNPISTATNIEQAISTGLTLYPEGVAKQMVLITDGAQNDGDMSNISSALIAANVTFKTIKLDSEFENEVYISDVTIPDTLHVGDKFSVTANIKSNIATTAVVSLYSGRTLKAQENVKLEVGDNQFVFNDVGDEGGIKSYRVVVEAAGDTISVNNEYSAFTQITAKPKILVVEGEAGKGDQFAAMLDALEMNYDKVTPSGVPTNVADLTEYKCVVSIDVYYKDFKKGFPKVLESYVKDYAGGYICIGGENSYALGGYKNTELETILPVDMDLKGEKEIPKMAMVMVIDHSGSMSSPSTENTSVTGLDLAKQAAIEGVSTLRATDECGVLVFDDGYIWTVPLKLADDVDSISESIATIGYGGGTSIFPALAQAAETLAASDAQIKHIILLTDGQDSFNQFSDVTTFINDNGITLSSVAVGADADVNLMQSLADTCDGRYYYTDIDNEIPRIFAQEVYLSVKSYLINREFTPIITNRSDIINEVLANGYPVLKGYIATTPKSTATVILESDSGDPILSTWQYGLGKTIAWTSDGENKWTGKWASWNNYGAFWKNAIDYVISDTSLGDDTLEIVQGGTSATIRYGTSDYDQNTKISGVCTTETGETIDITLNPVAPGIYETDIDLKELGVYSISIRNKNGDEIVKSINTATALQYSPEYRFDTDTSALDSFVASTNGEMISYDTDVFNVKLENVKARVSLTNWLLLAALLLFMLDIIARRFQLDYFTGLKKLNDRRKIKAQEKVKVQEKIKVQENVKAQENVKVQDTFKEQDAPKAAKEDRKVKEDSKTKVDRIAKTNSKTKKDSKVKSQTINTAELLKKKQDR